MRSAQKKTPASEKKNGNEQTSGKKLVQARLPFKILAGTPPPIPPDGDVPSDKLEAPPKKRKLSYTESVSENQKKIGKSDSKENLTLDKVDTTAVATIEDAIVLDDEDSQDDDKILSPKTPIVMSKNRKSNKSTPRNAGSAITPKVQIKLPLSGKKKKRKSKNAPMSSKCEISDSSDVEIMFEEQQNPNKKVKLAEDMEQKEDMELPGEYSKEEQPEVKVDLNKNKHGKIGSPKRNEKMISCTESAPNTRHSSKTGGDAVLLELPKKQNDKKKPEGECRISETVAPLKTSPKKRQASNKLSEDAKADCIVKDLESDAGEFATPVRKMRSPRRSIRQSEAEQKKGENQNSIETLTSDPEIVSEISSATDTSIHNESRKKLLTPKQLKQMEQRKKAREEKEHKLQQLKEERDRKLQEQREERERKLQEEKVQKQKERDERELQRKREREEKDEQKRKEKEEKEEQRRKEKEDKERKRLAEIEAKNEEKRKKDEAKEEERRKKEEDRRRKELEKEEEENKKKKAAQAFTKFFVTKAAKPSAEDDQESRDDVESVDSLAFRPFQVKGDMKLAPLVRREFKERSRKELDSFLCDTQIDKAALYICELKSGKHVPLRGSKTVLKDSYEDEVIIIENELETAAQAIDEARPKQLQKYKAKFYAFRENRRPPFYGTWMKKSTVITPRKPFATDKKFFDYEVDSDDEWEEEEPGESLNGSEDEKDESEDEDYEVDNEWFVPHGHLSDEELQNEDELGPDTSREAQKAKLKALQQEFAQEMKKKTEKIKPRLIGAIWEDENGSRPNLCPTIIWDSLCTRAMIYCEPPLIEEPETIESEPSTPPLEKQKRLEINDELMSDLVRLVHGNRHSRVFLIKEFMEHVSNTCETIKNGECLAPTKSLIREKIDEISEWSIVEASSSKKKNKKKLCWVVSAGILDKYSLGKLGLRNQWSYKLQPKFDVDKGDFSASNETQEIPVKPERPETPKSSAEVKKKSTTSRITKFAKVLTKEEKQNQQTTCTSAVSSSVKAITSNSPTTTLSKASAKTKAQKIPVKSAVEKSQSPSSSSSNKIPLVKKRVALLMSVPPGHQISPQSKNALISNFLQKNKTLSVKENSVNSITQMDVDEIVVLD